LRAAFLLLCLAIQASGAGCHSTPARPNILFITIDTLRADHCSLYGYERRTTPRLEELAKGGVVFERAYASMATTLPSHATMFTGLLPRRHGVVKNGLIVGRNHDTLAERLSRHGYDTGAIVSSFVVNRRFGLDQGFSSYDDEFPKRGSTARNNTFEDMEVPGGFDQRAERTREKALAWLDARGYLGGRQPGRPFFLWVHFFDPHDPYVPPHRFRRAVAPRDAKGELQAMIASYDGEVRYTDAEIGALADALAKGGLLDQTLLVVTADHGEGLMSHGHQNHGLHLYEEAVHVPLLLRWPRGLPRERRIAAPVSLADLLPTLLEIGGIPEPAATGDGLSLLPILRGEQDPDPHRAILLERREYESQRIGDFDVRGEKLALRLGQFKYIAAPEEKSFELFDLEADPGERRNLFAERAKESAAMQRVLTEWRTRPAAERAQGDQSSETLEALRALGYVQ